MCFLTKELKKVEFIYEMGLRNIMKNFDLDQKLKIYATLE